MTHVLDNIDHYAYFVQETTDLDKAAKHATMLLGNKRPEVYAVGGSGRNREKAIDLGDRIAEDDLPYKRAEQIEPKRAVIAFLRTTGPS